MSERKGPRKSIFILLHVVGDQSVRWWNISLLGYIQPRNLNLLRT